MLYWRSNTGITASVDYTNGALDIACYIDGPTLEQQHVLIIPTALDVACYIGGATLEQQHVLIIPTEYKTEHDILAEQHWSNSLY